MGSKAIDRLILVAAVKTLREVAASDGMLEVGRKRIEDELVEWRERRISQLGRANGFVIRAADGEPSSVIRFGPEVGLRLALEAIADRIERTGGNLIEGSGGHDAD